MKKQTIVKCTGIGAAFVLLFSVTAAQMSDRGATDTAGAKTALKTEASDKASVRPSAGVPLAAMERDATGYISVPLDEPGAGYPHNQGGIAGGCPPCDHGSCPADLTGNGAVGVPDLLALLAAWGPCPGCPGDDCCPGCTGDLTCSTAVGVPDLLALLSGWGECPVPPFTCPDGATQEAEECGENINSGCLLTPPAFQPISVGEVVCGTSWSLADPNMRDADGYVVVTTEWMELTFCATPQFEALIGVLENSVPGSGNCATATGFVSPAATAPPDVETCVTITAHPGTWHWWFRPTFFGGMPCDSETNNYVVSMSGEVIEDVDCGHPVAGDCCAPDGNFSDFCNDAECCEAACDQDAFCCDGGWDASCAFFAIDNCDVCFTCGNPNAGDCCDADGNGTHSCDDADCCNLVCGVDSTCCGDEWTAACAAIANDLCGVCGVEPLFAQEPDGGTSWSNFGGTIGGITYDRVTADDFVIESEGETFTITRVSMAGLWNGGANVPGPLGSIRVRIWESDKNGLPLTPVENTFVDQPGLSFVAVDTGATFAGRPVLRYEVILDPAVVVNAGQSYWISIQPNEAMDNFFQIVPAAMDPDLNGEETHVGWTGGTAFVYDWPTSSVVAFEEGRDLNFRIYGE